MKKNFARKVKRIKSRKRNREIRASYWGWCKWGDCKNLWRTITNNDMSFADRRIIIKMEVIYEKLWNSCRRTADWY